MTRSGCSRLRAAASPRYAASFVSGFSRIVHVLKTTTSAPSAVGASPSPSSSSMPLIRSLSWAFIWQPNVVTWYRRMARKGTARTVALVHPDDAEWDAWTPAEAARRLDGIDVPWRVSAGWAIDLFLGRE